MTEYKKQKLCNSVPEFLKFVAKQSSKYGLSKLKNFSDEVNYISWIETPEILFGIAVEKIIEYVALPTDAQLPIESLVKEIPNRIAALIQGAAKKQTSKSPKLTKKQLQKLN